jgi:S1-C subfamily serine protease
MAGLETDEHKLTECTLAAARGVRRSDALMVLLLGAALGLMPQVGWAANRLHAGAAAHATAQRAPGYLGIEFHDLSEEQASALHLRKPVGVEVLMVDHDGPAGQAGLQPRDIITGLNGNVVASGEALRRMIHDAGAGVSVMLDIFREGRVLTIRTKLASREDVERRAWARVTAPDPPASPPTAGGVESYTVEPAPAPSHAQSFIESMLHGPFTGLMLEGMQPQLRSFFGAPRTEGLLVQAVEAGSPAANAGLVCADVIVRADDVPLHTPSDWTKHLHASKGKPVNLTVVRQRHELMLTLQPDSKRR